MQMTTLPANDAVLLDLLGELRANRAMEAALDGMAPSVRHDRDPFWDDFASGRIFEPDEE